MKLTWDEIQAKAVAFSKKWKDAKNEEAEAQGFLIDFLRVFGVNEPMSVGEFEYKVSLSGNRTGYIDYLWKGQIAIEMKSRGKGLSSAFEQLRTYMMHVPEDEIPDLWMVCNFEIIRLCRRSTNEFYTFKTKDLRKHIKRFANIAGYTTERIQDNQIEVNIKAAEKMAKLHDALKDSGFDGHNLEVYLVRLLFCMFADDTGIFPKDSLFDYIEKSRPDGSDLSDRIARLFEVLNMPDDIRAKRTLLSDELKRFRYINGGLFGDLLPSAEFDTKMRRTLLDCINFDWNTISPAIFGAMFQGVMDKTQRREMGAHYTSEENILKLINPLFLDELWKEFDRVKTDTYALNRFHDKIARLKFLDPACGCGNFLIITYRELRLLELEILKMQSRDKQRIFDISILLKVSVEQFYGIEYEDFPCQIAQVGMWLTDHQMNLRVSDQFGLYYARLPLTQTATIVHGNALRIDWESVVSKEELSYILGNPPFVGYANQNEEQRADMLSVYRDENGKPFKNAGKIDYVSAWYYKAAAYLQNTQIHSAFVATNSITQGEQVAAVWKPLFEMFGIHIDFGYRTFKWTNEAKGKAAVHCVIIGFSVRQSVEKIIYDDAKKIPASNINPYLVDAPDIFIENRTKPLCDVLEMQKGNIPVDGGNLIIENNEIDDFLNKEPQAAKYIRKLLGADEFINKKDRYCLWLVGTDPAELRKMPLVLDRINKCKSFRLASSKAATRKYADYPAVFMEIRQPQSSYILIPRHSSEKRRYIPFGFIEAEVITTDANSTIEGATLYHFGVLTSSVHMAWVRAVCGRIKSDYRYSNDIVYNNFPWPSASDDQKAHIEKLAQSVLDARATFPNSSLADLYDPLTMPPDLLKAHKALDISVLKLYGFGKETIEAEIIAGLMDKYLKIKEICTLPAPEIIE